MDFPGRHGAALWLLASESPSHVPKEMPECFSSVSHIKEASANSQELLLLCSLKDFISGSPLGHSQPKELSSSIGRFQI